MCTKRIVRVNERGTAVIEMIFAVALFMLLVFGALELARAAALKHAIGVGAWQGSRYLSLNPWDEATAEALARQEIAGSIMGGDPAQAVISLSFSDPGRGFGTAVSVRVEMPYQALVPLMNLAPRALYAESILLVEAWP